MCRIRMVRGRILYAGKQRMDRIADNHHHAVTVHRKFQPGRKIIHRLQQLTTTDQEATTGKGGHNSLRRDGLHVNRPTSHL